MFIVDKMMTIQQIRPPFPIVVVVQGNESKFLLPVPKVVVPRYHN